MNVKSYLKDRCNKVQFVRACEKVRTKHNKLNNIRLKILKTCLRDFEDIGIPVSDKDKSLMVKMIGLYDETLDELRKDIQRFRVYAAEAEAAHLTEREQMYQKEKNTIKTWLDSIGAKEPVGYWYNYGARKLILYTNRPGPLIGKMGKNVELLKVILNEQMIGDWSVEFIEIKGGFVQ